MSNTENGVELTLKIADQIPEDTEITEGAKYLFRLIKQHNYSGNEFKNTEILNKVTRYTREDAEFYLEELIDEDFVILLEMNKIK